MTPARISRSGPVDEEEEDGEEETGSAACRFNFEAAVSRDDDGSGEAYN